MDSALSKQVLAAVKKSRMEPVWFFESILNIKTTELDRKRGQNWDLDPWQVEMIESVADVWRKLEGLPTRYNHDGKDKITIRAMHGPGKTFGVAGIMHWFNFVFEGRIICTAPKENQLRTRLWPAFRAINRRAPESYRSLIRVDSTKITWAGDEDHVALAETASEPENLQGHHGLYQLFIVDEASGMREEMFPVIEGAQSTGIVNITILIGNPTKNIGTFYDSHMRDKVSKNYHRLHVDLNKTTRVSKDWVRQMEDKYGKDSPVVKIRCYGEFADSGENQVIALQWIMDAYNKEYTEDGSISRIRVSVDVADGGEDETVISVRRIYDSFSLYLRIKRFSFPTAKAPIMSADAAIRMYEAFGGDIANGDDFVVDSLGVGAGTAGYLIKKGYSVVVYKGGESSDDTKRWRNRRTQSYMVGRDELQEGLVVFHDECFESEVDFEDFCAQMCSVHRNETTERVDDLETKKQMKARGIKSPDMADSFMMQYATQAPTLGGSGFADIEVIGETEMSNYEGAI